MKDTLQTRKEIEMYIEKRVIASWDTDEVETINSFREFLQDKMEELEHHKVNKELEEFYHCIDEIDTALVNLIDNDYLMTAETNDMEEE